MRAPRPLTHEEKKRALEMLQAGRSVVAVSKALGGGRKNLLYAFARAHGFGRRAPYTSPAVCAEILKRLMGGLSPSVIAAQLNVGFLTVKRVAEMMRAVKAASGRIAFVAGPVVVHTGGVPYFCQLIELGYVQTLLAGNALAVHDIEVALSGTSLGIDLSSGHPVEHGHRNHMRAINSVRRAGGIGKAVEKGVLKSGIMHACHTHGVQYILAGSIRDDGPLPDVITDAIEAQRQMRAAIRDVTFCLMIATMLHSVAVGNLLPAWVKVVCVDINPSTAIKLSDRGSFQTLGLVTDVEPFLRALVQEVNALERPT